MSRGCEELAQRIIARARQHGTPVAGNRDLAAALVRIDRNLPVPGELLPVVCEVIAFVLEAENELRSVVEPVPGQPDEDCIQAL